MQVFGYYNLSSFCFVLFGVTMLKSQLCTKVRHFGKTQNPVEVSICHFLDSPPFSGYTHCQIAVETKCFLNLDTKNSYRHVVIEGIGSAINIVWYISPLMCMSHVRGVNICTSFFDHSKKACDDTSIQTNKIILHNARQCIKLYTMH